MKWNNIKKEYEKKVSDFMYYLFNFYAICIFTAAVIWVIFKTLEFVAKFT